MEQRGFKKVHDRLDPWSKILNIEFETLANVENFETPCHTTFCQM